MSFFGPQTRFVKAPVSELAKVYETISVTDARSSIADLTDSVAFHHKRVILSKQGRPCAVVVPIADLQILHMIDAAQYQRMHSRESQAEHEETVSLKDAAADESALMLTGRRAGWLSRGLDIADHVPGVARAKQALGIARSEGPQFEYPQMTVQDVIVTACSPAVIERVAKLIVEDVSSKVEHVLPTGNNPSKVRQAIAEGVRESFERQALPERGVEAG